MGGSVNHGTLARAAAAALVMAATLAATSCKSPVQGDLLYWKAWTNAWSGLDMVLVDGGSLQLGSTTGYADESPVHTVTISPFYMSATEVSQAVYYAYMNDNPSNNNTGAPDLPVENVSWLDAIQFCNLLSDDSGYTRVYTIDWVNEKVTPNWNATGYRLPTEAEWEYAARGGPYSGGYMYAGSDNIDSVGWTESNSGGTTQTVAQLDPNELGLCDMTGNVWEYCWDHYDSTFYSTNTNWTDPAGPYPDWQGYSLAWTPVLEPVVRGGSYLHGYDSSGYDYCSLSYRGSITSSTGTPALEGRDYVGFRVVKNYP